jgi:hypothetical protein
VKRETEVYILGPVNPWALIGPTFLTSQLRSRINIEATFFFFLNINLN